MLWALTLGSLPLPPAEVARALLANDGSHDHIAVLSVRLPRVLAGALVGAALAVSGALMQAITGNPLASPGLSGVSAGAAFAVVLAIVLGSGSASAALVWFGFAGGMLAALMVFAMSLVGPGKSSPLRLVLAGAILSAALASATGAILLLDQHALDQVRFWMVGSLAGRSLDGVVGTMPLVLIGLAGSLLISRQVATLSLGDDLARGLGQRTWLWRLVSLFVSVLLAASAITIAGPIGFVGLIVPHVMRVVAGTRFSALAVLCALGGAILVVMADGISRVLFDYRDIPVGVAMSVIGAPFFIYLAAFRVRA
jgi:iron complex transport system permease protein